jgi:hypothetical protein
MVIFIKRTFVVLVVHGLTKQPRSRAGWLAAPLTNVRRWDPLNV